VWSRRVASPCKVGEAAYVGAIAFDSTNLTVDVPTSGTNDNKLVLSGNVTVAVNGDIGQVFAMNDDCLASVAPGTPCNSGNGTVVTLTAITPVVVVAGQQALVTVVISFS
jgi:hypothetical protein